MPLPGGAVPYRSRRELHAGRHVTVPVFLALDLGTSELKAGLVRADGELLDACSTGYETDLDPATGRAEQDPEAWWAAVRGAVAQLTARAGGSEVSSLAAVCVVGQGPTLVAANATGGATRPAVTWMDGRLADEREVLERETGVAGWGLGVTPAARLVERCEPRVAEATRWYLDSWDWIAFRMTGEARASRAPGQAMPDATDVQRVGVPAERLPPRVATGEVLGVVLPAVAPELGIAPGTPVVAGCVDAYAAFFGAGLEAPGDAIDTGGTSGGLGVYWDREISVPGAFAIQAPLPGRWLYGGAMTATGRALDWLACRVFGDDDPAGVTEEVDLAPAGSDGVVFLPYLAGERSPIWDPAARGAFAGLRVGHRRPHLVRAVLEAAAFALRHVATPIRSAGIGIRDLRVSGGTARNAAWNRIKADVLQVPVAVPSVVDTAMVGAAVIAATGTGNAGDVTGAMRSIVRLRERIEPDPRAADAYDEAFARYLALYPALAPVMHALHERPSGR